MRLSVGRALIFGQNDIWVYGNFLSIEKMELNLEDILVKTLMIIKD